MDKKIKLKSQKGITGADVIISILIILTALGVITMMYVNLTSNSNEIDRKTGATRIATNVIENIDSVYYSEIETRLNILSNSGTATKVGSTYTIVGQDGTQAFGTTVPAGYKLIIELQNFEYDIVKKVDVKVQYTVNKQVKTVGLTSVIEKETVRECNSPKFTDEYIRQMVAVGTEYEMFSGASLNMQTGIKIICPVQYDSSTNQYKIIDVSPKQLWYSYSNKNWARVLVLESNEITANINTTTKVITNKAILKSEKSYVWVPRFGVKNGGNLFGDTFFKYKNSNFAILSSFGQSFVHNYVDSQANISWSTRGISFETSQLYGKWSKYSELATVSTDAYYLNQSQYGPMAEY